jgi:hypothetical protein
MAVLAKDVELRGCGSFSVTLGYHYEIQKEEFWLYFSATWRGQPVRFTQKVDRLPLRGLDEQRRGAPERVASLRHRCARARRQGWSIRCRYVGDGTTRAR